MTPTIGTMGSGALRRTRALDGFELVAESGRVIAVLGPNGGMTTFVPSRSAGRSWYCCGRVSGR